MCPSGGWRSLSRSDCRHSTRPHHRSSLAQAGASPVRERETTSQPASTSVWQTRLPMNPLPPKTATRGVTAATAAKPESTSICVCESTSRRGLLSGRVMGRAAARLRQLFPSRLEVELYLARDRPLCSESSNGDHNVTTKTILGARVRRQVGVPHGAHHRRILEEEKKRGMRGPATRSAFWGCRACKAARDEATKEAREARRRRGELGDWDDWKQEDSEPPQASLAHILSGSCAGNKEEARHFMRKLDKHTARATARVEREAPDSKDTATFLDCHTDMGAKQRQDQGTGRGTREEYRVDKAPVHGMEGEPRRTYRT
mmetsp:Transcript_38945/g.119701  ORF Transcript_38945/g.119701 Transcript_38945/m.119701 type:complete len:316 (-) Transcript_38945:27-974(-)